MRIGVERNYERALALSDWTADTGSGIIGFDSYGYHRDQPEGIFDFVLECFKQFAGGLPDPKLHTVIKMGIQELLTAVDVYDPYNLLCGTGNVNPSEHWCTHTIDILDPYTGKVVEAKPETLETFVWVPGQADRTFHEVVSNVSKGIEGLPHGIGSWISEMFYQGGHETLEDYLKYQESEELCNYVLKHYKSEQLLSILELSAWGAYVWFLTPKGQEFLTENHDVYWLCATEGMAILYDSNFIKKEHYVIHERQPHSCVVCGLDAWCVELAQIQGVTRLLCERHLNGDTPLFAAANCGSRSCRFVNCPSHPQHGQDIYNVLSGRGQLNRLSGKQPLQLSFGGTQLIAK